MKVSYGFVKPTVPYRHRTVPEYQFRWCAMHLREWLFRFKLFEVFRWKSKIYLGYHGGVTWKCVCLIIGNSNICSTGFFVLIIIRYWLAFLIILLVFADGHPTLSERCHHKRPIMWKALPCHDVFMTSSCTYPLPFRNVAQEALSPKYLSSFRHTLLGTTIEGT